MALLDLCRRDVATCAPDASVQEAARTMRERHVGAIVVVRDGRPVGIVTDRDLATEVLGCGRPATAEVSSVMTPHPTTIHGDSGIADAAALLREHGIRRLPVVDEDGRLAGIVTFDDILELLGEELSSLVVALGHEHFRERRERPGQHEEAA